MDFTKEILNEILVKLFNAVLFNEEDFIKSNLNEKITLRGVHAIEAIDKANKNKDASMKNIASILGVTAGTLTTLLKKLETKGYITKKQSKEDKRKYFIQITRKGEKVLNVHKEYHENMIDMITRNLSPKEINQLIDLMSKVKYYFMS